MPAIKKKRLVVGLTGGLGSGKSTVLKMLKDLGARTSDADQIVRQALEPAGRGYKAALRLFGPSIRRADGTLDRQKIAEIVFQNSRKRKALERRLHPLVIKQFKADIARLKTGVLVLDVPLLYEAGLTGLVDAAAVVWAPDRVRVRRLLRSGRFSRADISRRMKAQMPLRQKRRRADWVVDNSGSLRKTRREVRRIWRQLTR
jgi:dephospho-CoA kinase